LRNTRLTRSLITLAHDDEIYLPEALAAGALGYLLERQPDAVLVRPLRLLSEGIPPLAPPIAARLLLNFTARPTQARSDDRNGCASDAYGSDRSGRASIETECPRFADQRRGERARDIALLRDAMEEHREQQRIA
jgi:hypothetical protein